MSWLDQLKARLKAATPEVWQSAGHYRPGMPDTDLDKAIRIIECYEQALKKTSDIICRHNPYYGGLMEMYEIDELTEKTLAEAEKIKGEK